MTTSEDRSRHDRVQELFLALVDQDLAAQEEALSRTAEDADVVSEVRELLGLDRAPPAALANDRVKLGFELPPMPEEVLPSQIGPYRVLRSLGRGGMGHVYEAEQQNPRRRVAVKVLHTSAAAPEVLHRFQHEAQVLALLQHPGIAQVIEAGMFDHAGASRPFIAMESVDGQPLDEFVRERSLDRRSRLELFARVCDAVHHAHRRGVVHRDLKPANILVQEDGQPKVLDFGIARLVATEQVETQWTAQGQVIGTLGYMSPEQARGESHLDTSSDVYSLGVLLYELMSGQLPYEVDKLSLHAAVRVVVEVEPRSLGGLDRRLRGDVETIAGRALEKNRERRYDSAAALAEDVRRHLQDLPINARPPTSLAQALKFARRNRTFVTALVLVLASLATGLVVSLRALNSERSARAAESEARRLAEREAATATAINEFLLQDMLRAVNPLYGGRHVRVADVLDAAEPRIEAAFAERPLVRAAVRVTLGSSYLQLGLVAEAERILAAAVEERSERLGSDHPDTLKARYQLALTRIDSRHDGALEEMKTLLELYRERQGPGAPTTLRAWGDLGVALGLLGRFEEAVSEARAAHAASIEQLGPEHELSQSNQRKLAEVLEQAGRFEEALALLTEHLEAQVALHGDAYPKVLELRVRLVHSLMSMGDYRKAEALVRSVIPQMEDVFGEDSIKTLDARAALAGLLDSTDRWDEATALHRSVVDSYQRVLGRSHPYTLLIRNNLAIHLRRRRNFDEAEETARQVLAERQLLLGADHESVAESFDTVAAILQERGQLDEAAPLYEQALQIARDTIGPQHPRTVDILFNRASLALKLDDFAVAEREFRALIAADTQLRGEGHPYIAAEKHQLGEALCGLERHEEAIVVFGESIALREALGEGASWRAHMTRADRGKALLALGRTEEAEKELLAAHHGLGELDHPDRLRRSGAIQGLVALYEAEGRDEEAARFRALLPKE